MILRRSPRFAVSRLAPLAALAIPWLASLSLGACSSKARDASDEGRDEFAGQVRDTSIKHEDCDPKGKQAKTLKADDRLDKSAPYVTHVFDGGREVCSFSDINGDGRVDLYTYFDETGAPRRHEAAYGVDKNVTEIGLYKGGQLDVIERDTTGSGHIDTWDFYEAGHLARRERDKNGDGRVDEWWTFEPGADQATIVQADPRSGKPDPNSSIKVEVGFVGGTATSASPAPKPSAARPATTASSASSPPSAPSSSASATTGKVSP